MDPSYNNGVGSQVPQSNPQGFSQQQPIISSGNGDIVLNGGAKEQKSHKGVVVLIILVVLLVFVGGGILLWQSGVFGGGSGTQQVNNEETAYNSYINYVLYGEDNGEKPKIDSSLLSSTEPYFVALNEDQLGAYLENAKNKYNVLSGQENEINILPMRRYFQDFVEIPVLTIDDLAKALIEDGKTAASNLISEDYNYLRYEDEQLNNYVSASKELANSFLNILVKAQEAKCLQKEGAVLGCYTVGPEDTKKVEEISKKMASIKETLHSEAMDSVEKLYEKLYGSMPNGENEND